MKRQIAVLSLLLALTVSPALAQLGSGIVYDPTNYQNAVLRYMQLQKQLLQLQQRTTSTCSSTNSSRRRPGNCRTWWPGIAQFLRSGRISAPQHPGKHVPLGERDQYWHLRDRPTGLWPDQSVAERSRRCQRLRRPEAGLRAGRTLGRFDHQWDGHHRPVEKQCAAA